MSPNRLSWRYVSAAAALALEPISGRDGCTATSVTAAPATAPRRTREVLRIIHQPFRLQLSPTTEWNLSVCHLSGTQYRAPVELNQSQKRSRLPKQRQLACHFPSPPPALRSERIGRGQP